MKIQCDLHLHHLVNLFLYAFNVDENDFNERIGPASSDCHSSTCRCIFISAKLEEELKGLMPTPRNYLESYGVTDTGLMQLIHAAYDTIWFANLPNRVKKKFVPGQSNKAAPHRKQPALFMVISKPGL